MQGRFDEQRELLDAESVAGHLSSRAVCLGFWLPIGTSCLRRQRATLREAPTRTVNPLCLWDRTVGSGRSVAHRRSRGSTGASTVTSRNSPRQSPQGRDDPRNNGQVNKRAFQRPRVPAGRRSRYLVAHGVFQDPRYSTGPRSKSDGVGPDELLKHVVALLLALPTTQPLGVRDRWDYRRQDASVGRLNQIYVPCYGGP